MLTRRNFLIGASASLVAAPALVRAQSLMQIRGIPLRGPPLIKPEWMIFPNRLYMVNLKDEGSATFFDTLEYRVVGYNNWVADSFKLANQEESDDG